MSIHLENFAVCLSDQSNDYDHDYGDDNNKVNNDDDKRIATNTTMMTKTINCAA